MKVGHFEIYFSGLADRYHFGSGFAVHEHLEPLFEKFNPINLLLKLFEKLE